jgi:adenosylcobinamide-phosphate synthase
MLNTLIAVPFIFLLDRLLGEPRHLHPLIGFGILANKLEAKLNCGKYRFNKGWLAWGLAVIPITVCIYWISNMGNERWQFIVTIICAWLAIGWQSLKEHGLAVSYALNSNNLGEARIKTSYLVSRDTSALDETELSRATIESLLENGSDAIFAPF